MVREDGPSLSYMANAIAQHQDQPGLRYHYALMLAQQRKDYAAARRELAPVIEMVITREQRGKIWPSWIDFGFCM